MDSEVALATGYATFLLVGAVGLDRLARHAHMRADRYRTAGFRYHPQHDAWVCPQDEWLWPAEFDHHRRLVRYRAKPSVCNACPVKGHSAPPRRTGGRSSERSTRGHILRPGGFIGGLRSCWSAWPA